MCPQATGLKAVMMGLLLTCLELVKKGHSLTALYQQNPHGYTKEELMKMKVDKLRTVAERQHLDKRGNKTELIDRIISSSMSPEDIKSIVIYFKFKREKGKSYICQDYGLFFNNVEDFDKFLADVMFPWTVKSLMMVYFIFIIRASVVNSYSAYIELASDQVSSLSLKRLQGTTS